MADLKKLVDKDILKLVLTLFKDNYDAGINSKGYLTTEQVLALINAGNFQNETLVTDLVNTEIAKILDNAPEDFDTLKELADWIQGHSDIYDSLITLIDAKVDSTELTTTLADYVTKAELTALEMTEEEARGIVNSIFTDEEVE